MRERVKINERRERVKINEMRERVSVAAHQITFISELMVSHSQHELIPGIFKKYV